MTDSEIGQILKTLAKESKRRTTTLRKQLRDKETEEVEFLDKCRSLVQSIVPGPVEVATYQPLERAYQIFVGMVSTIQTHLKETKAEQKEETARLLLAQHTAFSEAYKVLQDHMEESIVTEEVLRDWADTLWTGIPADKTNQTRHPSSRSSEVYRS